MLKVKRLLWFLSRPRYYPELFRRLEAQVKFFGDLSSDINKKEKQKAKAKKWCEDIAIDTTTAIIKVTGLVEPVTFDEKFKEQLKTATEIVEKCPIKMGGPGNLDLIYQLAEYSQATRVIETGVAYGWSSLAFLLSLQNRHNSLLVSNDFPYLFKNSEKYVGCVVPSELKSFCRLLNYPDRCGLPNALNLLTTIDMCHYDSDKSYEGRLYAYPQLYKALRKGGIFVSDDVDDNFGFRGFCNSINQEPIIVKTPTDLGVKYVGILVKS